jgi:hypothetical protein
MQTAPVLAAQLDANPTALHRLLRALLSASRVIITNVVPARALMSILGRTRIVSTRAVAGPSAS